MKHIITILTAVLSAAVLTGCMSPKGDSIGKQKAYAKDMGPGRIDHDL